MKPGDNSDRLSFLPNHIVHHIISFTSIKDVAKLSFTSKKWENLCLTAPSLRISGTDISLFDVERVRFMDFLVNFMRRRNCAKMTDLYVSWSVEDDLGYRETNRILWLLNHATECHLNNLRLNLNFGDAAFVMPMEIFWNESLTSLAVGMTSCQLEFPFPYGFSNLKQLRLEFSAIANDLLGEWISSVCRYLEILRLTEISGMKRFKISSKTLLEIHITSCNLDHLDIASSHSLKTIQLHDPFDPSSTPTLRIHAPYLLNLRCSGICIDHLGVEKSELGHSVAVGLPKTCPIRIDDFKSLLSSIDQVTELVTDCFSIQGLYLNNCLPFELSNLQSLVLYCGYLNNITIPATVLFLQGLSHCLKKLRILPGYCVNNLIPQTEQISDHEETRWWLSLNQLHCQNTSYIPRGRIVDHVSRDRWLSSRTEVDRYLFWINAS
ncbi:hypothetical protein ACFE04_026898 [Oxalis oulophora]